jgi:hypothetical protein
MGRNPQLRTKSDKRGLVEFTMELSGVEFPVSEFGTKSISLRIHETDVFLAEALAEFGNKKRAAILNAAVSFGLNAIIEELSPEDQDKIDEIELRIRKAAYGITEDEA